MKIIIIEGIATSGKTSLKNALVEKLEKQELKCQVVEEDETLMPILHNKDLQTSLDFLDKVIDKLIHTKADILIFDRLYFTHIFRTNSTVEDFKHIEDVLKTYKPLVVLLRLDEATIPERITDSFAKRDQKWIDYVRSKGTDEQIVNYYTEQQRKLIEMTKETTLAKLILNATKQDFSSLADQIIREVEGD